MASRIRRGFKPSLAICALIASAWTILATSSPNVSLNEGSVFIQSDCTDPAMAVEVDISNHQIVTSGYDYSDFGFPSNTVYHDEINTGEVNGYDRVCERTYGDSESSAAEFVFSCFDNGEFVCTIFVNKL